MKKFSKLSIDKQEHISKYIEKLSSGVATPDLDIDSFSKDTFSMLCGFLAAPPWSDAVQEVSVNIADLTSRQLAKLLSALAECRQLVVLRLTCPKEKYYAGQPFKKKTKLAKLICSFLVLMPNLENIDFSYLGFSPQELIKIFASLQCHQSLHTLSLLGNEFGMEGMEGIIAFVSRSTRITSVAGCTLSDNESHEGPALLGCPQVRHKYPIDFPDEAQQAIYLNQMSGLLSEHRSNTSVSLANESARVATDAAKDLMVVHALVERGKVRKLRNYLRERVHYRRAMLPSVKSRKNLLGDYLFSVDLSSIKDVDVPGVEGCLELPVLAKAALNKNQKQMRILLEAGAPIGQLNYYGESTFYLCFRNSLFDACKLILEYAPKNYHFYETHQGPDILQIAMVRRHRQPEYLLLLVNGLGKYPAYIANRVDERGYNVFTQLVVAENWQVVTLLLEFALDPNVRNHDGSSALCIMVMQSRHSDADRLIHLGADVDIRFSRESTDGLVTVNSLCVAIELQDLAMIQLLLLSNAKLAAVDLLSGRHATLVGYALSLGYFDVAIFILKIRMQMAIHRHEDFQSEFSVYLDEILLGISAQPRLMLFLQANPAVYDYMKASNALHRVIVAENAEMLARLLGSGFDPQNKDSDDVSAYQLAIRKSSQSASLLSEFHVYVPLFDKPNRLAEAIEFAITHGSGGAFKFLLNRYAPGSLKQTQLFAFYCMAVVNGQLRMALYLITQYHLQVNQYYTASQKSPLSIAIDHELASLVQRLIVQYGANPLLTNKNKTTVIDAIKASNHQMQAVIFHNFLYSPFVTALMGKRDQFPRTSGLDLQQQCLYFANTATTLVHFAVVRNHGELIDYLCGQSVPVDIVDSEGISPLVYAILSPHVHASIVGTLVACGADLTFMYKQRPLVLSAIEFGEVDKIAIALQKASKKTKQSLFKLPLLVAAVYSHKLEMVQVIIDAGFDPDMQHGKNIPALFATLYTRYFAMVRNLIALGADVNVTCQDQTVLSKVVADSDLDFCKLFVDEMGADPLHPSVKIALREATSAVGKYMGDIIANQPYVLRLLAKSLVSLVLQHQVQLTSHTRQFFISSHLLRFDLLDKQVIERVFVAFESVFLAGLQKNSQPMTLGLLDQLLNHAMNSTKHYREEQVRYQDQLNEKKAEYRAEVARIEKLKAKKINALSTKVSKQKKALQSKRASLNRAEKELQSKIRDVANRKKANAQNRKKLRDRQQQWESDKRRIQGERRQEKQQRSTHLSKVKTQSSWSANLNNRETLLRSLQSYRSFEVGVLEEEGVREGKGFSGCVQSARSRISQCDRMISSVQQQVNSLRAAQRRRQMAMAASIMGAVANDFDIGIDLGPISDVLSMVGDMMSTFSALSFDFNLGALGDFSNLSMPDFPSLPTMPELDRESGELERDERSAKKELTDLNANKKRAEFEAEERQVDRMQATERAEIDAIRPDRQQEDYLNDVQPPPEFDESQVHDFKVNERKVEKVKFIDWGGGQPTYDYSHLETKSAEPDYQRDNHLATGEVHFPDPRVQRYRREEVVHVEPAEFVGPGVYTQAASTHQGEPLHSDPMPSGYFDMGGSASMPQEPPPPDDDVYGDGFAAGFSYGISGHHEGFDANYESEYGGAERGMDHGAGVGAPPSSAAAEYDRYNGKTIEEYYHGTARYESSPTAGASYGGVNVTDNYYEPATFGEPAGGVDEITYPQSHADASAYAGWDIVKRSDLTQEQLQEVSAINADLERQGISVVTTASDNVAVPVTKAEYRDRAIMEAHGGSIQFEAPDDSFLHAVKKESDMFNYTLPPSEHIEHSSGYGVAAPQ